MAADRERKQRWLSEEEAELWAYVVRDATSLRRKRRKLATKSAVVAESGASGPLAQESVVNPLVSPGAAMPPAGRASQSPQRPGEAKPRANTSPSSPPAPPPLASYDWRQVRRLARGRDDIEARLDLHGRRQHEAYAALRSFLFSCYSRGFRNVLVITGKGGRRVEAENCRFVDERGVLRRLAPEWLREPEFRQMVVSYTESHEKHGGNGALYIKLRRAK